MTSNLRDDILMNPQLFARVKAIYEQRDELDLDAEQRHLLEETYLDFVGGGAELDDADKDRMREINTKLSTLRLNFGDNVLAETNRYQLFIEDEADLAGLPPGVVAGAADAAAKAGQEGKWLFTTHRPSMYPFLQNAENRELREQILTAYIMRGDNGNEYDNKEILSEILTSAGGKGEAAGLRHPRRLRARAPNGQDPGGGLRASRRPLVSLARRGPRGGGDPAGGHRRGRLRLQTRALGLALLRRKGPPGPLRRG